MYPQRQSSCKVLVNGTSKQTVKRAKTPTKSQLTTTTSNLAQHTLNPLEELEQPLKYPKYNPKMYEKTNSPLNITIEFNESAESADEEEETGGSTNWNDVSSQSKWFTDPPHLTDVGGRRSKHEIMPDQSLIQDYVSTLEKLDNLRTTRTELEDLDDDLAARADLEAARAELAKSYTSHLDLELEDIEIPKPRVWTDPGVASNSTPYRGSLASLRLNALRLEERRLLEIRRLQELERLRGPQKHWYELKTSQFCVEARKNNELLSAKKSWSGMREYTEDVWKSRDLSRGDCTF